MRFRIDVRIHANGGWSDFSEFAGDFVEVAKFFFAFDVEGIDAFFEGVDDFLTGFTNACEGAVSWIATGFDDAEEFATGNDIEASAFGGKQAEDGKIGVRFDSEGDFVIDAGQGFIETFEMIRNRSCRVDIKGSAVLLCKRLQGNVFAKKLSVLVGKAVHGSLLNESRFFECHVSTIFIDGLKSAAAQFGANKLIEFRNPDAFVLKVR